MKNFKLFSISLLFFLGTLSSFAQIWEKSIDQDTPVTFNFRSHHNNISNATISTLPSHGSFVQNPTTKSMTYWPTAGFIGTDSFKYRFSPTGTIYEARINVISLPCSVPINGNTFGWNWEEGQKPNNTVLTYSITQPAANAGFVLDLYKMDNSFNAKINGINIATVEMEFQAGLPSGGLNIRFQDGSNYRSSPGQLPAGEPDFIYAMTGTEANPLIRVKISPTTGKVLLFGSKRSNGPLYPLELFRNTELVPVTWNVNSPNQVVFTQTVYRKTQIQGKGYGLNKINNPEITVSTINQPTCVNGQSLNNGSIEIFVVNLIDGMYTLFYDGGTFPNISIVNSRAIIPASVGIYNNIIIGTGACTSARGFNAVIINPDCSSCIKIVGGVEWNKSFTKSQVDLMNPKIINTYVPLTVAGTNAGMFFDIYRLDNSFDLKINGKHILTDGEHNEMQFDIGTPTARTNNIRFLDGGLYGIDADPIWKIMGTAAKPAIRVEVSPQGKVKLYGSKKSGGPLYELKLYNGAKLNDVNWNKTSNNLIEVTQDAYGSTKLHGKVYGENICSAGLYEITKTGILENTGIPPVVGDKITYTIKVKNIATEDITEVKVVDPLLGGVITSYVESLSTNGVLNIGETWTYTADYEITGEDIANEGVYNLATVFGKDRNGNPIPTKESIDPNAPGGSGNSDCLNCTFTAIIGGNSCDFILPIVSVDPFYWAYNYSTYKGGQSPVTNAGTVVGTNKGFEFDIYRLDNSFNIIINGEKLYDNEIQLDAKLTSGVNMLFVDGDVYGENGIPRILSLRGDQENPMLKVKVSADGIVQLLGSKTSNGVLVELKPKVGSFNPITWNTDPNLLNTITVSQEVWWKTVFEGYGYGMHNDCESGKSGGDILGNADEINMVKYYPNPVNTTLYVQANTSIKEIEIYNMIGQRLIHLKPNSSGTEVNMEGLQAAIYMMKLKMNGRVETYRVVKQ